MKKATILVAALALVAANASADALDVNASAAMNGTNFGLEVLHDNSSPAYVQDDTPGGETVYRFEFLYNPTDIAATGSNDWIMTIFGAMGTNPRPNNAGNACPLAEHIPVFPARIMAFATGPNNTTPGVRMTAMTNFCGIVGTPLTFWTANVPKKICGFIEIGSPISGGIAVIDPGNSCPSEGDAAYKLLPGAGLDNSQHAVEFARLGNLAVNPYNAGEVGSVYFDEFASFRTLAP